VTVAETAKVAAVVVPLGLDTFGVAVALGIAGLPAEHRLRVALLFAAFEAAMPLIGVALGAPIGRAIGNVADYVAAVLIVSLGTYMLLVENDEEDRLQWSSQSRPRPSSSLRSGFVWEDVSARRCERPRRSSPGRP
jgi:putative Mn2+ efflux pump MntP